VGWGKSPADSVPISRDNFIHFSVDLPVKSAILVYMNSKERMKSWESLSLCEQVPWETWKRILSQANFDIAKAKLIAKKIVKKKG
jgi:hypothetical protein